MFCFIALLFFSSAAIAGQYTVSNVSRKSGGTLYNVRFSPSESGQITLLMSAANFRIKLYSLAVKFDDGVVTDYSSMIPSDFFVEVGVTSSLPPIISDSRRVIGITIRAESFGGIGSLMMNVESTGSQQFGQQFPPPVHVPIVPSTRTVVCASVQGGGYQPRVIETNSSIGGGYFNRVDDCNASIRYQSKGIICAVRNDGLISVYDFVRNQALGEYIPSQVAPCLEIISSATNEVMCSVGPSLGQAALYQWRTDTYIDQNYRPMQSCLESLAMLKQNSNQFPPFPFGGHHQLPPVVINPGFPPINQAIQTACDSSSNTLINLSQGGALIYDFSSPADCQSARQILASGGQFFCESSSNTLNQFANSGGTSVIYDFSTPQDCQTARDEANRGQMHFCESSSNTLNRIFNGRATLIYDFTGPQDCQAAKARVAQGRNFCESSSNTLHDANGTFIFDFSSWQDCINALN